MPDNIDRTAMERLEQMGFELEGIRPVEFYFFFKQEYQAYSVAAELHNLQFKTVVSNTGGRREWTCLATKSIDLSGERLEELRVWMESLARRHEGEYDGWGTGFSL